MLHLLDHPVSSYAQKVKIALREKDIPFRAELPEDFGTGRADGPLGQASPRAEVPVLIDGDMRIFESTVILEYIEERWSEPPLLPRDLALRAQARITEDVCDCQYEAVNWGYAEVLWYGRAAGALADRLRAEAARQTALLQDWLVARLGGSEWFGGAAFGWADAAAAPMVNRSVHYGLGPASGGALAEWHRRLCARPSVAATFAEFEAGVVRVRASPDLYRTGGRRREYRDHRLEWMIKSGGIDVVLEGLRADNVRFGWPT